MFDVKRNELLSTFKNKILANIN